MNSNIQYYNGVPLDERQQHDLYRASSLAMKVMLIAAWVAILVGFVIDNDPLLIGALVIGIAGMGTHEFAMRKSGVEEYATEELARNPNLRRGWMKRSLRFALIWGIIMATAMMLQKGGSLENWLWTLGIGAAGGLLLHLIDRRQLRQAIAKRAKVRENFDAEDSR